MPTTAAAQTDLEPAVSSLAAAFAHDPITSYLLQPGESYPSRLTQFFSLLLRARVALGMPILVARDEARIVGAVMGYSTAPHDWPADIAAEWDAFERTIPGFVDRQADYDAIVDSCKPSASHYYLGAIGVEPSMHGRGFGKELLEGFCELSANDPRSSGVFLETAKESNVGFYERAGFVEVGRGTMGGTRLWCMFREHARSRG